MSNKSITKFIVVTELPLGAYSKILMIVPHFSEEKLRRIANLWNNKTSLSKMAERILGNTERKTEMFRILRGVIVVNPSHFGQSINRNILFRSWTFFNN